MPGDLPSRFAVEEAAVACVGVALRAAAVLHEHRGGPQLAVGADRGQVAAAVRSEHHFSWLDRPGGAGFAPLSRFWRTGGGWVRTHANYPWHQAALLRALGCAGSARDVATAVARLSADEVEERVVAAGGVAAAVRSGEQWRDHPQGQAVAAEPLVGRERLGDAMPRQRPAQGLPASGVRVLDLTRVIAGPVNSMGQEDAARASLSDAQAVQQAAEDRMAHGLATLPDVLEARSATAQADY